MVALSREELTSEPLRVQVQVCGKQEALQLGKASIQELSTAVERYFEVRPPFLFMDRSGKHIQDDEAFAACVSTGSLVLVRLTEGVLHDLSRRMDQLRHLQWGYFSDQMGAAQSERTSQRSAMKQLHASMDQGLGSRESLMREWQKSIDACQDAVRKEKGFRDEAFRGVADRISEMQQSTQLRFEGRDAEDAIQRKRIEELSQGLDAKRNQWEQDSEEVKAIGQRCQRELGEARTAAAANEGTLRGEVADLRQQVQDLRQALSAEQRDRATVAMEAREAVSDLQRTVDQEVMDRQAEAQDLMTGLQELEATVSSSVQDVRQTCSDITKRMAVVGDACQEDRLQRQKDSIEFSRQVEALRRSVEREAQDFAKRTDDECGSRETEVARLSRLIADEASERRETHEKLARMVAEDAATRGQEAAKEIRELHRLTLDCQQTIDAEKVTRSSQYSKMEQSFTDHKHAVSAGNNVHRQSITEELSVYVRELKTFGPKHAEALEVSCHALREESEVMTNKGLEDLEVEIRKDLRDYAEAIAKLRVDCKEAMHREVKSRQDNVNALQDAIDYESKARVEGMKAMDRTVSDLRQGPIGGSVRLTVAHPGSPQRVTSPAQSPQMILHHRSTSPSAQTYLSQPTSATSTVVAPSHAGSASPCQVSLSRAPSLNSIAAPIAAYAAGTEIIALPMATGAMSIGQQVTQIRSRGSIGSVSPTVSRSPSMQSVGLASPSMQPRRV